ncbi:hypothetical protein D9758_015851 [Tetrapyrgos nigripes]|uniref:Galactose mutarotase n=1 Tax=Tetrapyrgos nigripes TaxID=182062 RepID=A0A8H5C9T6_9AGAR|nr:hypothetical protein D9758_015851 [Tetrapyrgos nigripes]
MVLILAQLPSRLSAIPVYDITPIPTCHSTFPSQFQPFDLTTLSAPDGSITAKFVSFGATMTELWVKDRNGRARDVILGYDDNSKLLTDPAHPVFNPIVGRYANRIKNGSYLVPSCPQIRRHVGLSFRPTSHDRSGLILPNIP